ncbi:MAG: dehydrogenase [Planctomycetota bacterium]|nr:MAG: dehydrogenase [Planctomycetota bacterium]
MSLATNRARCLDADLVCDLYRTMQIIRQTEEELARCHQRGLIHGACHTYVGQEAIAAGVCAHLSPRDVAFSTHRGHGHALAKGLPPRELMAELFGREGGCSRGRGGSMHLFAPEIGMMGTSGIVGPCILQACGGGYSARLLNNGCVAVAFFGDGAVNNGAFHEGLNMASIWRLPVLFVCENNQFATEVPFAYASGNPSVGGRGAAYGIPGFVLDGNDVLEIHRVAGEAIARARAGEGPTLIECKTYRTRAHAEGMPDFGYRTREEVEAWKQRCPIAALRAAVANEVEPPDEAATIIERFDAIDAEVRETIREAREFAEASPLPGPATATDHVYATPRTTIAAQPPADSVAPPRTITYSQATLEALAAEMARNDRIFVLGEGIGKRGGNFLTTKGLFDLYGPARLCDTPICERGFVGLACGAAMTGTRPVVDFMFADFVLDAFGEIVNQVAKMQYTSSGRLKMPVVLRGCIGIGHSAATHHSGSYYGAFAQAPGLRVVVPSSPEDAKGLLTAALRCDDPVVFLEHRELLQRKGLVPEGEYEIEFGKARVVRCGEHITVVALARMVHHALAACDELAREGISVEVVDPRTVSPLDAATILASVHKTGRLLVVDELPAHFGFSAEIAARVADEGFDDLDAPIRRLTGAFCPTPYSPALEASVVPGPPEIAAAIRGLMQE